MTTDLIDNLISDWKIARPDLDAKPMGVVGRILRLGKILEIEASCKLKPYQLQYTELDVLATIRRKGEPFQLNPKQLIESVLITSGAMTACLNRLENRKLIKRIPDPNDRRGKLILLTNKGKKLIDKAIEARFNQAQSALEELTNKEQDELANLLAKLSKSIGNNG